MGHRKARRDAVLLAGVFDECADVIADDLGHARGEDRNHFGLVQRNGILQRLVQIVLPAKHGAVLTHGRGHGRSWLAKVPIQCRPVIRGAALRPVYQR